MQKASLFIATPCYNGNVQSLYVISMLGLQRLLMQEHGYRSETREHRKTH
ncbi:MAG TPA: hypothetical protein VMG30_18740 [Acidobacteriota bacterium]|nr:hypothetical protein [Acidobacteriota bacterium]